MNESNKGHLETIGECLVRDTLNIVLDNVKFQVVDNYSYVFII